MTKRKEVRDLFRPNSKEFFLIAGPCLVENHQLHMTIVAALQKVHEEFGVPVIFKASFDKANRSQVDAPRGPGYTHGLELLGNVRDACDLPILTDIHTPDQAAGVATQVDVLQIPAFLCRQTSLLEWAADTGLPINIKKGQWCTGLDMLGAVDKVRERSGIENYPMTVTERGTFFGYGDLVVDMRSMFRLRATCNTPVIFDGTHSIQRPGLGVDGSSGGNRGYIIPLVCAAVAAGANALFLEVHPAPASAPSDADSMLLLDNLMPLMEVVMKIRQACFGV